MLQLTGNRRKAKKMKRYLVLVTIVLITAVFLAAGCGGNPSISGKYVYKDAPAGQSPILDFKSDGTMVVSVPAQVDPQTNQKTEAQSITWYYETSPELVKMWQDKKEMTSSAPNTFLLMYKDTLIDSQGQALVKEGTASNNVPSSSTPSSTP